MDPARCLQCPVIHVQGCKLRFNSEVVFQVRASLRICHEADESEKYQGDAAMVDESEKYQGETAMVDESEKYQSEAAMVDESEKYQSEAAMASEEIETSVAQQQIGLNHQTIKFVMSFLTSGGLARERAGYC